MAIVSFIAVVGGPGQSLAAVKLFTVDPDVTVYSGPGEQYRVLMVLPAKSELKAASEIVSSKSGRYYRVVVRLSEKQKAIGFIPVNANVRTGDVDQDEEDLTKYGAVALFSRAFQLSYAGLKNSQKLIALGYLHYLSPGFYVKGFGGQWTSLEASGLALGGEIGNDALLIGALSGFVTYGMGMFSPNIAGTAFDGSGKYNVLMSASFGVRYNVQGFASLAVSAVQLGFYNQNNSLVTNGVQASLEVGL